MGLKDLFFTSDQTENKVEEVKTSPVTPNKFPTDVPTNNFLSEAHQTFPQTTSVPVSNEHLNKFIEMYQSGFDGLNIAGYDFYEFFQAIVNSGGIDNPQMYTMAMTMGIAMDKTTNKDRLLSQADFYVNEVNKVYNQYVSTGTSKKQDLMNQKNSENSTLIQDINNLKAQIDSINAQINAKQNQLSAIGSKYDIPISEIDSKLKANEIAKETILSNILKVKAGISNNLK